MINIYDFLIETTLILENKIQFLKKKYKDRLNINHDSNAVHKDVNGIVDYFTEHGDPTNTKSYSDWLLQQYSKGNIKQEDALRLRNLLQNFDTYKHKLSQSDKNIMNHKNVESIITSLQPHIGTPSTKREEKQQIKNEGIEHLYSGKGIDVYKLKSKEASQQLYGGGCSSGGTEWCTADRRERFNQYNTYTKDTNSNNVHSLYPIHTEELNKLGQKKRYQLNFHPEMGVSLNDEFDYPVNVENFIKKYPDLKEIPEFQGKDIRFTSDENIKKYKKELIKTNFRELANRDLIDSNDIDNIIRNKKEENHDLILGSYDKLKHSGALKDRHLLYMLDNSDSNFKVNLIQQDNSLSKPIIDKLIYNHIPKNYDHTNFYERSYNFNFLSHIIEQENIQPEHIRHIYNFVNNFLNKDDMHDYEKFYLKDLNNTLLFHPNLPKDLIKEKIPNANLKELVHLSSNPNLDKEDNKNILHHNLVVSNTNDKYDKNDITYIYTHLLKDNKNLDSDDIHIIIDRENIHPSSVTSSILGDALIDHPNFSYEHYKKLGNDGIQLGNHYSVRNIHDPKIIDEHIANKNLHNYHITQLLDNPYLYEKHKTLLLSHPNLTVVNINTDKINRLVPDVKTLHKFMDIAKSHDQDGNKIKRNILYYTNNEDILDHYKDSDDVQDQENIIFNNHGLLKTFPKIAKHIRKRYNEKSLHPEVMNILDKINSKNWIGE